MVCKTLRGLCLEGVMELMHGRKGNAHGEGAKFRWAEPEWDNLPPIVFSRDPEKLERCRQIHY